MAECCIILFKMKEEFYIYIFLDNNETPLYVGRTINLIKRVESDHFISEHGNLSLECINETRKILFHKAISSDDMKIKERYLINKLSPKYNKSLNNDSKFSFSIDIDWKLYSVDYVKLIEKRNNKKPKKISYHSDIIKTPNNWLPYGVILEENKIDYLKVTPNRKKKKEFDNEYDEDTSYFIEINNKLYINNFLRVGNLIGNYKEFCKKFKLNREIDFLTIFSKKDSKLFTNNNFAYFVNYEIVKQNRLIEKKTLNYYDKKINDYFKKAR